MHNVDPKSGANCGFCYVVLDIFPGVGICVESSGLREGGTKPGRVDGRCGVRVLRLEWRGSSGGRCGEMGGVDERPASGCELV